VSDSSFASPDRISCSCATHMLPRRMACATVVTHPQIGSLHRPVWAPAAGGLRPSPHWLHWQPGAPASGSGAHNATCHGHWCSPSSLPQVIRADASLRGVQAAAAKGGGGESSRQSLESLRSENEALRNSISEAEAAVGQLSDSGAGGAGGANSPEAVLAAQDNGSASGNKTSATAALPSSGPSEDHPAGKPSTSNEHAGAARVQDAHCGAKDEIARCCCTTPFAACAAYLASSHVLHESYRV